MTFRRTEWSEVGRKLATAGLALYLALVLGLTLLAFPQDHPPPNWVPLRTMARDLHEQGLPFLVNFLGNLGVFLPFGMLLPVVRREKTTAGQVARWGFVLSAGIELAQYVSGRRVADVDDVLLNVAGGLLGYALFRMAVEAARLVRKRSSQAIGQATT
jgi:glycopeptide antibiotics resistance protein